MTSILRLELFCSKGAFDREKNVVIERTLSIEMTTRRERARPVTNRVHSRGLGGSVFIEKQALFFNATSNNEEPRPFLLLPLKSVQIK